MENELSLKAAVGCGYEDFWNFKGRYRVCKGSRASKKSKTTALNFIVRLLRYPQANLLVVRRYYTTLKDSCYAELCWAIRRLGLEKWFECKLSPLEIIYRPTGQKIFFRGLDDSMKITSITVKHGCLCWLWIEEAFEIGDEAEFNMLDESIRGAVPDGLFKQVTITFNPWSEHHWLKRRFFDCEDSDILAKTTTYHCNEFIDEADKCIFERMKKEYPQRYKVAGLGEWGISEVMVYTNWRKAEFDIKELKGEGKTAVFGLDFGYTNDETALFCGIADMSNKKLYVFDEVYEKGMSNERIFDVISARGYAKERIRADCAEPKSIDRLRELGLIRIRPARKGRDSITNGIDFLQGFEIIIKPRCINFISEISSYCWQKDKNGKSVNIPTDEHNHLMDAMRYAVEELIMGDGFSFE
ncbi:MAG: PBSX family phage terminase large subunit [Firmicutes bacterium]|nr:PBSX family phage terminase large subunit [Bacillota bacterium]